MQLEPQQSASAAGGELGSACLSAQLGFRPFLLFKSVVVMLVLAAMGSQEAGEEDEGLSV